MVIKGAGTGPSWLHVMARVNPQVHHMQPTPSVCFQFTIQLTVICEVNQSNLKKKNQLCPPSRTHVNVHQLLLLKYGLVLLNILWQEICFKISTAMITALGETGASGRPWLNATRVGCTWRRSSDGGEVMRLNGWRGDHRCQTVTGPGSETLEQESDGKVKLEVATFFSFFLHLVLLGITPMLTKCLSSWLTKSIQLKINLT